MPKKPKHMFQICQNESRGFLLVTGVFVPDMSVSDVLVPDVFISRIPLSHWATTSGMLQATLAETMLHCETLHALRVFPRSTKAREQRQWKPLKARLFSPCRQIAGGRKDILAHATMARVAYVFIANTRTRPMPRTARHGIVSPIVRSGRLRDAWVRGRGWRRIVGGVAG
jgi:hypothetical protein